MVDCPVSSSRLRWAIALLCPALVIAVLHARSIDYDFVWTDQSEIALGLIVRPPGRIVDALWEPTLQQVEQYSPGAAAPYYRPLQVIVVSEIDHRLGRRPAHFRAFNLLVAAATFVLFALLVGVLFRDPLLAGLAAALAAAHPAGIENYVWIAGMPSSLLALFRVLGLITVPLALRAHSDARRALWVGLGLIALLLGLASKEDGLVTPGITAACIASLWVMDVRDPARADAAQRKRFWNTALAILIAQAILCLAYFGWWRPSVLGGAFAGAPPAGGRMAVHLLTVLASWPDRLAWLLWPAQSTTSDVVPLVTSLGSVRPWLGALLVVAAPLLWLLLLRSGRAALALGWAWAVVAFLPASGLVPLTHLRAERYLAPSVFGLALIVAWLLTAWGRSAEGSRARAALPAIALGLAIVLALGQRTFVRVPDWQSDIVLFERDVQRDPFFREGYFVLATALSGAGRHAEAKLWLERLLEVEAGFGARWSYLPRIRVIERICDVNYTLGDGADTLPLFGDDLVPDAPGLVSRPGLYRCGARSLEQAGRPAEALGIYHALRTLPGWLRHPVLMLDIARCHASMGEAERARGWLRQVPDVPALADDVREVEVMLAEAEAEGDTVESGMADE